ncbi:MAG TPA: hypothetical protein VK012_03345 [Gemmatimonadales bacterium]|nr:hypothetical protein [Gemmatimonadales bacterium]
MRALGLILLATVTVGTPAALAGQDTAAAATSAMSRRDYQLTMLEHQRAFLLKMADSMPERLYREKATPEQRDFAQQIHHAAGAVPFITSRVLKGPALSLPDTATALNSREGLRQFINASYDYGATLLKDQSDSVRTAEVNLFGNTMPAWQVWDELHAHTIWTAGQVVANFRENGMAPPAFTFF